MNSLDELNAFALKLQEGKLPISVKESYKKYLYEAAFRTINHIDLPLTTDVDQISEETIRKCIRDSATKGVRKDSTIDRMYKNWIAVVKHFKAHQQQCYSENTVAEGLDLEHKSGSTNAILTSTPDYSVLSHERNQNEGELEIVFGEINKYQSLCRRFPELEPKLTPLLKQAKQRSAGLLGSINALTEALRVLKEDKSAC